MEAFREQVFVAEAPIEEPEPCVGRLLATEEIEGPMFPKTFRQQAVLAGVLPLLDRALRGDEQLLGAIARGEPVNDDTAFQAQFERPALALRGILTDLLGEDAPEPAFRIKGEGRTVQKLFICAANEKEGLAFDQIGVEYVTDDPDKLLAELKARAGVPDEYPGRMQSVEKGPGRQTNLSSAPEYVKRKVRLCFVCDGQVHFAEVRIYSPEEKKTDEETRAEFEDRRGRIAQAAVNKVKHSIALEQRFGHTAMLDPRTMAAKHRSPWSRV